MQSKDAILGSSMQKFQSRKGRDENFLTSPETKPAKLHLNHVHTATPGSSEQTETVGPASDATNVSPDRFPLFPGKVLKLPLRANTRNFEHLPKTKDLAATQPVEISSFEHLPKPKKRAATLSKSPGCRLNSHPLAQQTGPLGLLAARSTISRIAPSRIAP